ncbi:MAG: hypothetical protein ABEJ69_01180 [Candidatus Nanohaloarchaea archaeon]
MKYSKYILDSVKQRFDGSSESEGFPDLNYVVGNTSGMDVAPDVPSPMSQRIGQLAQRGGSVMELIISNPATFQVDKEEMMDTIDQLDIDVSLHSDPSTGFASAYRTRGREGAGYDTAQSYFTRYLTQLAIFKREVENRGIDFEIQRINPHISTTGLPSLTERMADDVGVDPFGFEVGKLGRESLNRRNREDQNIFQNKEFLRRFYYTFLTERTPEPKWRLFTNYLSRYSRKFDRIYRDAQRQACDYYFQAGVDREEEDPLMTKVALVSSAARSDVGTQTEWLDLVAEPMDETVTIEVPNPGPDGPDTFSVPFETLEDINNLLGANTRVSRLASLPEAVHRIRNEKWTLRNFEAIDAIPDDKSRELRELALEAVESRLEQLWKGNGDKFLISVEGKRSAISNHLDIDVQQILQSAVKVGEAEDFETGDEYALDEAAEKVMMGEEEFFVEDGEHVEQRYHSMMEEIGRQYDRLMWMESNLFYFIMPAWMTNSSEQYENHGGWDAPEFIWETLVERRWEDKYDIDLTDPGKEDGYFQALEENREFQMDVAAAVASVYVWGHFTQKKDRFKIDREQYVDDLEGEFTWIEWMNQFGIGVNMETMVGGADQLIKIWRPKDIVTACRAINMTAQEQLDEIHPELDDRPAKFTIDLEHTASFGVDPWKEMELLIEQEEELAKSGVIEEDSDKPLAKMLRNWHMIKPGLETRQSESRHGPWARGDVQMYEWLYKMVDAGFARNPEETAYLMYEVGGEQRATVYTARIAMNLIELGVEPDELDPTKIDANGNYDNEKEALMARFFGMDKASIDQEWAKIEEHAFDPLKGLLEAEEFEHTWSKKAMIENDVQRNQIDSEEYR